MKAMKIGLAQIYPRLGDLQTNLHKHLEVIEDAVTRGAELIVFPELSLTGYVLQDLTYEVAIRPEPNHPILQPLLEASRWADLVVGFVEMDERGRYYTTGAYLAGGQIIHRHRKIYLPTYGMFDEGRDMAPGDQVRAFDTRFGRFGLLICEDFWHISPPYLLWLDGAEVLIFTSASPGRGLGIPGKFGSTKWVELVNQAYASLFTVFVIHVNRAGFEDGQNFWGGSTIFDPSGDLVVQGPYFDEALILASIDLDQIRRTRIRLPLLRDERPTLVLRELQRILSL
ncbi:nitrilase-related carbon-nitrogen hydrolase [Thermoflexus sp.]|uniref:nitrilase-related carbon-nitrogen hydrolase n=1 Tax=Thermoflexus sp. TaxID=1969742 RepID=UPI0035E42C89